ncbi:MAG: helix-turn-helix domain-containing protein [Ignavibacteriales bacterium]
MVNINKLKGKIVENGTSIEKIAEIMGVDRSTLYRKLGQNGEKITIRDADLIAKVLGLKIDEVNSIFFSQYVA